MFFLMINILFVTVTLISVITVLLVYKVTFNYWKTRNVYTWKPTIPFGNARDTVLQKNVFGSDITKFYRELKAKSLSYGGYYLFLTPVFVPADIDLIKKIFVNDFEHFRDRVSYVDQDNDPLSANLLHLGSDRWKIIRSIVRPFIASKDINAAYPKIKQCLTRLVESIDETTCNEGSIDIADVLDRFNIDLIGAYFFNIDCNTIKNRDAIIKKMTSNFFNTSLIGNLIRMTIALPAVIKFFKIKTFNSEVTEFFTQFVDAMIESRKCGTSSSDVLDALTSNTTPLTKSEIVANAAVLFIAGYHTTSNTATLFLYELAKDKALQDAVRNEIRVVVEKFDGEVTYSALNELVLLDKCIKETLRKHPLATITSRVVVSDYHVPGSDLILKKGTHVYLPIEAVHWDPEFYPNPEIFDPERFSTKTTNRRYCAWLPFGNGPRQCIGSKLAIASLKFSTAALIRNYEFLLHPSSEGPIQYNPKAFVRESIKPIRLIAVKI